MNIIFFSFACDEKSLTWIFVRLNRILYTMQRHKIVYIFHFQKQLFSCEIMNLTRIKYTTQTHIAKEKDRTHIEKRKTMMIEKRERETENDTESIRLQIWTFPTTNISTWNTKGSWKTRFLKYIKRAKNCVAHPQTLRGCTTHSKSFKMRRDDRGFCAFM